MSSTSPSASPRWDSAWDNRNSGFISPSQLQLWRQQQQEKQHHFRSGSAEPPQSAPPHPAMFRTTSRQSTTTAQDPPSSAEPPSTHSRTMSHFSFFSLKSKAHHNPQPSTSSVATTPNTAGGRPDEFGMQSRSRPPSSQGLSSRTGNLMQAQSAPQGSGGAPSSAKSAGDQVPLPPLAAAPARLSMSNATPPTSPLPPLHREIKSILELIIAHGRKVYFSGPLVQHDEREPDGTRSRDDGWHDVWAQLNGTTISVWNMNDMEEANKQGRQVPPRYLNIQDAFVAVVASVTIPAGENSPAKKYTNVLTLNTAGVNLKLFACPSTQALLSWTAALRLAAYEKARLEEIYTAHLLRIKIPDAARAPTSLLNGRMEGWVQARIAGRTDWRSLWMVVSAGLAGHSHDNGSVSSIEQKTIPAIKKNRLSALFNRDHSPPPPRGSTTARPSIQFFLSNKQKDLKRAILTVREVTQAFAVYPERPDLIDQSSLFKVEGLLGDEEAAGTMRNNEGWILIIPEPDGSSPPSAEMRKFLIGIHDAFSLYGRPRMYNWDPRDPRGMMFAYPVGPEKDQLFLDRELAENVDPRDDRTSAIRAQLQHILWDRMRGSPIGSRSRSPTHIGSSPPTLPPLPEMTLTGEGSSSRLSPTTSTFSSSQPMQLPPLHFERSRNDYDLPEIPPPTPALVPARTLTPITENSDPRHSRSISGDPASSGPIVQQAAPQSSANGRPPEPAQNTSFFGGSLSTSPVDTSPVLASSQQPEVTIRHRLSDDSWGILSAPRPDSKSDNRSGQSSPNLQNQPFASSSNTNPFIRSTGRDSPSRLGMLHKSSTELQETLSSPVSVHPFPTRRASSPFTDIGRDSPTRLDALQQSQSPSETRQMTSSPVQSQSFGASGSNSAFSNVGRDSPSRLGTLEKPISEQRRPTSPPSQQPFGVGNLMSASVDSGRQTPLRINAWQQSLVTEHATSLPPSMQQQSTSIVSPKPITMAPGRASPAHLGPPQQSPSTARFSTTYITRDASLPAPPEESDGEQEPAPPPRHGVQLSDPPAPPSPRFSILTSPHSAMNSPIAERSSRHFRESLPSPRQSVLNMSGSHPSSPIIDAPAPPHVRSPPPAQSSAHTQSPMQSSVSSVRSTVDSPPVGTPVLSPRLVNSTPTAQPKPPSRTESDHEQDLLREAGALYYVRHIEQNHPTGPRRPPPPPDDGDDETDSESASSYSPSPNAPTNYSAMSPLRVASRPNSASPPPTSASPYGSPRGAAPIAFKQGSIPAAPSPGEKNAAFSPRMASGPARKPSGARAAPASKTVAQRELQQQPHRPPSDVDEDSEENMSDNSDDAPQHRQLPPRMVAAAEAHHEYDGHDADAVDALAALSFLEREEAQEPPPPRKSSVPLPPPIPQVVEPRTTSPPASQEIGVRSSFAPSKQASQRKAQIQAQQAASQAIMNKPGKAGRPRKARDRGAWGDSSDEEEEEEEEEDDDVDSDVEPPQRDGRPMDPRSLGPSGQAGYPPSNRGVSPGRPAGENGGYPQSRQRRDLPQVPPQPQIQTPPEGSEESLGAQRRMAPDQYTDPRRSLYPGRQASPHAPRPELPNPGAARQNVWSQALERDRAEPVRDTFIQMEPPSQTMTKAFAPHGLLSAGLQDKQDRSAKRQEELARETGASLINVPTKPPPPQTGLLGAVTAHERERKREGGLGAALTEREREKRVVEERQRKLDDYQRLQLEQMQQGGSVYGGMGMAPQFSGYNPMMNPMMMGMNPMMTGGWSFPGMVNPQHMFAAQQAAQAYQQAMMAFSTAGSQIGTEAPQAPLNPMMTGSGMMGGYDPRMSMMMPMMTGMNPAMTGMNPAMTGMNPAMTGMNPAMAGMNPAMTGMNPAMAGMNPAMTGMNPGMNMGQGMAPMGQGLNPSGTGLGMQMTGGSMFDMRLSPGNDGGMRQMSEAGGSQLPYSSQNSSANGQGSPAGPRSQDPADEQPKRAGDDLR